MSLVRSLYGGGRCPVCGVSHAKCGGPTNILGVDERMEEAVTEGTLRRYKVTVGNNTTHMRLNDADAAFYQRHHAAEPDEPQATQSAGDSTPVKAGVRPNARAAANKLGGAAANKVS